MRHERTDAAVAAMSLLLTGTSLAGGPAPLAFVNETATRLSSAPSLGVSDFEEKDYAWGDLDQDGDIDLIVARKQPFTNPGRRPNVLLMNVNGVLTDQTALYASTAINLPDGVTDQGFLTPTCDRDVVIVDVNGDGWLDIVTAVTLGQGLPKHIGHPRVYVNLGADEAGAWQGLVFDNARIPQMLSNPTCTGCTPQIGNPRFNAVAGGDLNGDGFPELFFGDHDNSHFVGPPESPSLDFNNKLLLNDGKGSFTDTTTDAITGTATAVFIPALPIWQTCFTTAVAIADMNNDGLGDLVYNSVDCVPHYVGIAYNATTAAGLFPGPAQVLFDLNAPHGMSVGDLNGDGWMDLIDVDDNADRYQLNSGTLDSFGQMVFGVSRAFPPATNGTGGNAHIADLNNDGYQDALIADVEADLEGCSRTADILINNADPPDVTFTVNSGGIPNSMLTGVHDFAVFDINNDGWLDLVVGRCTGTQVWIFDAPTPVLTGDLNGDGVVNSLDLGILLSSWSIPAGTPGCGGTSPCPADLNGDGFVNSLDLGMLLANWTL